MNKHGRAGVKRGRPKGRKVVYRKGKPPKVVGELQVDKTRPEYGAGYDHGRKDGIAEARQEERWFLESLQEKRNAKDIKGLVSRRLDFIRG